MDTKIERFLTKIGISDLTPFVDAYFSQLINEKETNTLICTIALKQYVDYSVYTELFDKISDFTVRNKFNISLSFKYHNEKDFFPRLLEEFKDDHKCKFLNEVHFFEDNKIIFYYDNSEDTLSINHEASLLKDFLNSISSSYQIMTQEKVYSDNDFSKKRDEEYERISKEESENWQKKTEFNTTFHPCKMKDVDKFPNVIVEGEIFKIEDKESKKNRLIRTVEFSDGTDSLQFTLFENKVRTIDEIKKYDVGVKIRVKGKIGADKYSNFDTVIQDVTSIEILPPDPLREDTYDRKRVELHAHTKMSAFDGVATVLDYAKTAKRWGHKAFAITDHGTVQAFPEGQEAAKKTGLKMIYGSELYMVDDMPNFIYNPSDRILNDSKFVVFDLETTGLSARFDRIIEFGAVKIDMSGQILDEVDIFVNPDMKLSKFSLEVSRITQDQVDHGKPIKKALNDILDFFGDAILVGHNVAFDYGFLNETLKNNNMKPISNPVIDTLPISRYLYPQRRRHNEEALARELDIKFDSTSAHRANYDAEVLAQIFGVLLSKLTSENTKLMHKDLENLEISNEMLLSMHPYHTTCYVKNSDGIKDLYKIISYSNTELISASGYPIVPKSYLNKMRKNLLLGTACFNGEIFEYAMTKSKEALKEAMQFYDFVEVQPPENYIYLIHTGKLSSIKAVENILKDIIEVAKSINKPVCATGDCHYLNPKDKIFRDVYISAKGLKGVRHPLNLAPYDSASESKKQEWYKNPLPNPNQHFRTTDEMIQQFSFLEDKKLIEEIVIDNPNLIADSIDAVKPLKDGTYNPYMPGCAEQLESLVYKTAKETYGDPLPLPIQERLEAELKGIMGKNTSEDGTSIDYSVIYWLSSLIVRWSNSEGYMIGSRGSVGSSLVATMSGITEVNPLPPHYRCPKCHYLEWADTSVYFSGYDLPAKKCPVCGHDLIGDGQNIPFATFLGFHAEKVPDIDLNFPSDFQSRAHLHMQQVLNATGNKCFKAGTIQTSQEKQARGYALGYYESLGKDKSKLRNAELDRLATGCVEVKRSTGQHPGGVIVIPAGMEVYDFTPVQYPADKIESEWMTTHFDYHAIHDNILKFDMLGHIDPQAIKLMCDMAGISFADIKEKIPISDPEALSLFWSPDALKLKRNVLNQTTGALGLPEFGTETGRRTLLETQPRSFADLVRISGLSHGTDVYTGNARDLILDEGKTLKEVICCRDDIMTTLNETYGIPASDAFAIMEIVRKGKLCAPGNEAKREKYTKIMKEHQVPDYYIKSCEKIKYMFPRAHAVAYVSNAVRCAWFKVHHPEVYYACYFSLRCDAYDIATMTKGIDACLKRVNDIKDRLAKHLDVETKDKSLIDTYEATIEMYDRGIEFANISISKSLSTQFTISDDGKIIPSFSVIDGVGASVGDMIVKAREEAPFTSVEDLKERAHVSDKMVEILRKYGALEDLPDSDQLTLF